MDRQALQPEPYRQERKERQGEALPLLRALRALVRTPANAGLAFLCIIILLVSCTKDITVDLPVYPEQLVVEGTIEPGMPPFVILTRTQSYFAPTDLNAIANMFVSGATVTVTVDGNTWQLDQLCSNLLDSASLAAAAEATGLSPAVLASANICIYTALDPTHVGQVGKTYRLDISAEGKQLSAVSTIPNPVPLDSVWFELALQRPGDDTLGFAWFRITDPDTMGNGYRWMAKRINHRSAGQTMDDYYISPLGSTYDDKYINGLTFNFPEPRGAQFYSGHPEDDNVEQGFFKVGDTIAVKALSIGKKEYDFYYSYDQNVANTGDIFGTPTNVKTNITGGLGIWAGRGVYLDTIVCGP
ncbi:MAG: DUF4249 domain-containing protein [Flavobacteriales bacterium]|nr:DUF4249 domain-containing protein [Flavobacteriales bacterium]